MSQYEFTLIVKTDDVAVLTEEMATVMSVMDMLKNGLEETAISWLKRYGPASQHPIIMQVQIDSKVDHEFHWRSPAAGSQDQDGS